MRHSFPLLEPPLEVSETFGGVKVSDDDQLKTEQKSQNLKISLSKNKSLYTNDHKHIENPSDNEFELVLFPFHCRRRLTCDIIKHMTHTT